MRGTVAAAAALALGAAPLLAAGAAGSSAVASQNGHRVVPALVVGKARYDRGVHSHISSKAALKYASASSPTVPMFAHTVKDGTRTFTYEMVGKSPYVSLAKPATTVNTVVVPVVMKFPNGDTFDPTKATGCASTSALHSLMASPLFNAKTYTWGGKKVGTGQYVSIFQRAEFYKQTKPGSINPGYQVRLTKTATAPITVNVPSTAAAEGSANCGKLGGVDVTWWDPYVQSTLMPTLKARGYGSRTFAVFLFNNVVMYVSTTSNCCVLGYHTAFNNPADGGVTTYATGMYDNTHGTFSGSQDISAISHEIAEWMDDPMGTNSTKPWGNVGQVKNSCQSNLEVGDPLSGTLQPTKLGARTWHPQELAFASWFYHQTPSPSVNGWFSSHGKFKADAKPCP